jgi:hypothetical protein
MRLVKRIAPFGLGMREKQMVKGAYSMSIFTQSKKPTFCFQVPPLFLAIPIFHYMEHKQRIKLGT